MSPHDQVLPLRVPLRRRDCGARLPPGAAEPQEDAAAQLQQQGARVYGEARCVTVCEADLFATINNLYNQLTFVRVLIVCCSHFILTFAYLSCRRGGASALVVVSREDAHAGRRRPDICQAG